VNRGYDFKDTVKEYGKWLSDNDLLGDNFIIVTCGSWDLEYMYPAQCKTSKFSLSHPFKKWINIKEVYGRFYKIKKVGTILKMLEFLNLKLEGKHHSGIDDCHNISRIWMKMYKDGFRLEEKYIHYI
jgi:inhibitor of KinA sporulation pathway (predicted exonuclease)